ncbi:hypothetical protein EPA93_09690 [Ktedonosporobacter rubrisoli]|uniref:Uncharacterized protein n=1 Tax=Ktedonosporobacter rubrisoli TaxID=2509675 RepID=A0A4P6JNG0_KTERU|nr:hypothetical protein [Ktedonosporobacter rubrisoli]QBD76266.1 hypothetical protein EPA93_09690 [Ktedonosporobacter rubrisoli]
MELQPKQIIIDNIVDYCLSLREMQINTAFDSSMLLGGKVQEQIDALRQLAPPQGGLVDGQVVMDSIRFLKEHALPGRQLHVVMHRINRAGDMMLWTYEVGQMRDGTWHIDGASGGSVSQCYPLGGKAWVSLREGRCKGNPDVFYLSGTVIDAGHDVKRIRVITEDGVILEDVIEHGAVLLIAEQKIKQPLYAELYDRKGNLVGSHKALAENSSAHLN